MGWLTNEHQGGCRGIEWLSGPFGGVAPHIQGALYTHTGPDEDWTSYLGQFGLFLSVSGILSLPVQLPPYCVLNMLASVHLILQAHSSVRAFEGSPPQYWHSYLLLIQVLPQLFALQEILPWPQSLKQPPSICTILLHFTVSLATWCNIPLIVLLCPSPLHLFTSSQLLSPSDYVHYMYVCIFNLFVIGWSSH